MGKPRTLRDRLREFWHLVKLGAFPPPLPPVRCPECGELIRLKDEPHYDEVAVGYRCAPQEATDDVDYNTITIAETCTGCGKIVEWSQQTGIAPILGWEWYEDTEWLCPECVPLAPSHAD